VLTEDNGIINWNEKDSILKEEAHYVWNLQKKGILRNIWFTVESRNAVLMIEGKNEENVRTIMDTLPLVREKMIKYSIIALTVYDGYERLFY
jgi:hypothetical protein